MSANVRHSSESNSHYTPAIICDKARELLGGIDLDPASCAKANGIVGAFHYLDSTINGYTKNWYDYNVKGNPPSVFLNPPGGKCDQNGVTVYPHVKGMPRGWTCNQDGLPCNNVHLDVMSSQKRWWNKLVKSWLEDEVGSAFFVGFSLEILQVGQNERGKGAHAPIEFPFCVPKARIAYLHEQDEELVVGAAPPHASVLFYLPPVTFKLKGGHLWEEEVRRFATIFHDVGVVCNGAV